MESLPSENPRGAVWNRWDPHIHAPGTILSDQYKGADPWEDFLSRIEKSHPLIRALGITDYYNLALYEQVVQRKHDGRLADVDLIFPNVEMRFGIETAKGSGINFHILFSPEDSDHIARVKRFLGDLHFRFQGESYCCEANDLIRLGKAYDQLIKDDRKALETGANQFKVNFEELRTRWRDSAWVQQNALVAVAGGRKDGTSALSEDASFTALRREIETFAHIIFSASPQQREFWLGKGVVSKEELSEKWGGCKPCLHGSDAHKHEKVGNPDLDRFCWIKGDLTFESLRQACLEPEGRALVHPEPPRGALPSQTIERVEVSNAPWFTTNVVPLNPGLIAIIGARGSGKTALADLIAAGAYALSPHLNASSFVHRAAQHLTDSATSLVWQSGEKTDTPLVDVSREEFFESPRVQYLSQQFVEQLCSAEGVEDELLTEIERVMFHSHSIEDRLGASSFRELLDIRLARARNARERQEQSLRLASESLTIEWTRKAGLAGLTRQREEKYKFIEKDKTDRKALTAKGTKERVQRLEEISSAVDGARRRVEDAKTRHRSLLLLQDAVAAVRKNSAPIFLKDLRKSHADASLTEAQWKSFELTFAGDVDAILKTELITADKLVKALSGPGEGEIEPDNRAQPSVTPYLQPNANLTKQTLSLLEKELTRLQRLVGIDAANAKKLTTLSEKIAKDESALGRLDKEIDLARGAETRIKELIEDRKNAYAGVFEAIIEEQRQLSDLYGPLKLNLSSQGGELSKLSFSVRRSVDVESWAKIGESLLDLRELGPFKGKGTLQEIAKAELVPAWERGTSAQVAEAMASFRDKHEQALIEHAPVKRTDRNAYAAWARNISDWLYGTLHVRVSYSLQYDGVEIEQLSPGTRGIVLLLLYVAVDTDDDRPLIIDQPEENLDPKSIYDDLVERFKTARSRRQIMIITHNANLVVNTDADQVIIAKCGPHRPGYLPEISYQSGGLENAAIRTQVCEILEGGEAAFKERAKRLRVRI
jgi:energy-coupling factor transporter ATP-binding protein EcfA2